MLPFVDLGAAPPSNSYLKKEHLDRPEKWYPLRVLCCERCLLVQTDDYADRSELFPEDYAYFSSFSSSWLRHAERYVTGVVERFRLGVNSHVVEVASNDGYLLQYLKQRGIPCLGIEPTASTAHVARETKGLDVRELFFGRAVAGVLEAEGLSADLMIANNVLAHVPDINDFVQGFRRLLKPGGVATFEFPHLVNLVDQCQFDTIYHEHYSYISLTAAKSIFDACGLEIFDVERIPTHGGSLRLYSQRADVRRYEVLGSVHDLLEDELRLGVTRAEYYGGFQERVNHVKNDLLGFLIEAFQSAKTVCAYGAAAKGNTLLNYAGIKTDLLRCVADLNPEKRDKFLPGSRIPIISPEKLIEMKPDYLLILPWNLKNEIMDQMSCIRDWGGKFVTAIPKLEIAD
jgi:SAM-dependent methyltransferase